MIEYKFWGSLCEVYKDEGYHVLNYNDLPNNHIYPLTKNEPHVVIVNSKKELYYPNSFEYPYDPKSKTTRDVIRSEEGIVPCSFTADALVTKEKNVVLSIGTADDIPLILMDKKNKVVGLAHVGWQGALLGIVPITIDSMLSLGADIDSINAYIGPAISQNSNKVSNYLKEELVKTNPNFKKHFQESKDKEYLFDLKSLCQNSIVSSGVLLKNINISPIDTYYDSDYNSDRKLIETGGNPSLSVKNGGKNLNLTTVEIT